MMSAMTDVKKFHLDLDALPISDDSKRRIAKDFKLAVLKELAQHDDGLDGVIIFDGTKGGMLIRDAAALKDKSLADVMKLGG